MCHVSYSNRYVISALTLAYLVALQNEIVMIYNSKSHLGINSDIIYPLLFTRYSATHAEAACSIYLVKNFDKEAYEYFCYFCLSFKITGLYIYICVTN